MSACRYLDTINSDTGDVNTISALNLIVFGAKLEHLDLIENIVVDLLKVGKNGFWGFWRRTIACLVYDALVLAGRVSFSQSIRPVGGTF